MLEDDIAEDPRKTGLKNGLRQLTIDQLKRVIDYSLNSNNEMTLDEFNYNDDCFCPLAIGLELDNKILNPTNEIVYEIVYETLIELGYKVFNTRGVKGKFYTDNRKEDLLIAAKEVLKEKLQSILIT